MSSNVIPMHPPKQQERKCSFCGKPESQVKALIGNADETKHICNECVAAAKRRLQQAA